MLLQSPALLLLIISLSLLPRTLQAQEAGARHQIQGVVDGMDSAQKARLAGEVLRVERGVLTALFDPVSRNMLLHVHPDSQLDKVKIDALLTSQGMSVRCLHRKPVDGQPFQSIDPTNCNEAVGLDE